MMSFPPKSICVLSVIQNLDDRWVSKRGIPSKKETQYTPERLIALLVEVKIENGSIFHRGIAVL